MRNKGPITDGYNQFKEWYKSKTIIGVLITAAATLLSILFPDASVDLTGAVEELTNADDLATGIDDIWIRIMQVVGMALAIYGRLKAKLGITVAGVKMT